MSWLPGSVCPIKNVVQSKYSNFDIRIILHRRNIYRDGERLTELVEKELEVMSGNANE